MKIGDEVYVHGYVDEIRNDVVIIRNDGGYFGTVPSEVNCSEKPNNSTCSKMEQIETEPQTCANCKFDHEEWFEEACDSCCDAHSNWQPKTEPQTESSTNEEKVQLTDCAWGKESEMVTVFTQNPDGTFSNIKLELDVEEALVICKALVHLSEEEDTHPTDRKIANRIRGDIIKAIEPKPRR